MNRQKELDNNSARDTMATSNSTKVGSSANDMKASFTINLRDADKKHPYRIELANQVVEFMTTAFGSGGILTLTNDERATTLNVTITACSEGSRCGRICCGELGVGWVVLKASWHLSRDNKQLTEPTKERFRDSGAIGCADLCDEKFGEHALLTTLTTAAAHTIATKATRALSPYK
jgi:hypothetical protein